VIDLRLGDGNGLEIVSIISKQRKDSKIIILTGYGIFRLLSQQSKKGLVIIYQNLLMQMILRLLYVHHMRKFLILQQTLCQQIV
jgi:DNA-binding NtrC family response regulator